MKKTSLDLIIIGGGASGVGLGVFLEKIGFKKYLILEKGKVGNSFANWTDFTRFISPSFTGNFFQYVDLNAVSPDTSPAYNLKTEHPTGKEYQVYLKMVADHFKIKVSENTEVLKITKIKDDFLIKTKNKEYQSRFVIWAGGEFDSPNINAIPGSELCIHSLKFEIQKEKGEYFIIGGYESGTELAINLLQAGNTVTIIDKGSPLELKTSDSSISVAPYTLDRLKPFLENKNLKLFNNNEVIEVKKEADNFKIILNNKTHFLTKNPPILATGFLNLPDFMQEFFEVKDGNIQITDDDESTITPNFFLSGPRVKHGNVVFCFIYKFRQRFAIVIEEICKRLNYKGKKFDETIEDYKKNNFYLKDLSCCSNECSC